MHTKQDVLIVIIAGIVGVAAVLVFSFAFAETVRVHFPPKAGETAADSGSVNGRASQQTIVETGASDAPQPGMDAPDALGVQMAKPQQEQSGGLQGQNSGIVDQVVEGVSGVVSDLAGQVPGLSAPVNAVTGAVDALSAGLQGLNTTQPNNDPVGGLLQPILGN